MELFHFLSLSFFHSFPRDEGTEPLNDRHAQIGPGKLGEGGTETEADDHRNDCNKEDDEIVWRDGDGIYRVAIEHIQSLGRDGQYHDAGDVGGCDIAFCEKQAREEIGEDEQEDRCQQ